MTMSACRNEDLNANVTIMNNENFKMKEKKIMKKKKIIIILLLLYYYSF